jgi:cytochrome P450
MIMMDPPKHGRMRALVSRAFNAQALARLEPRIQAVADQLTANVLQRRTVDFIEDFALPLPASVIALLLGLDLSLTKHFKRWSDDMVSAPVIASTDTQRQAEVRATVQEMHHHLKQVLDDRRRNPGDDMVSDLLRVQVDGESLSERELLGFFVLLLVAGLETTVHLLGHTARILAQRPEVLARVRAEPALIPRLIEEVLRYEPPTHATMRLVMEDVTLGGVKLSRGTPLIVMMGSACRDEAYVSNPEEFLLERTTQTNMTFGHGVHFCLGAPLGRLEAKLALETLLPRCAGFRMTGPVELTPA